MCTRQKRPIVVHCNVWACTKWFRVQGVTHRVKYIRQAREILERHGRQLVVKFQ